MISRGQGEGEGRGAGLEGGPAQNLYYHIRSSWRQEWTPYVRYCFPLIKGIVHKIIFFQIFCQFVEILKQKLGNLCIA